MIRPLIILVCILFSPSLLAEPVFIQSLVAKLYEQPSFKSSVLRQAPRGSQFELIQKQGSWYQVSDGKQQYWVARLLTGPHPPLNSVSILNTDTDTLKENARRRASTVVTAGAARGLTADSRNRASAEQNADYFSLRKIEAIDINTQDLLNFIQASSDK